MKTLNIVAVTVSLIAALPVAAQQPHSNASAPQSNEFERAPAEQQRRHSRSLGYRDDRAQFRDQESSAMAAVIGILFIHGNGAARLPEIYDRLRHSAAGR
jgi:hypothetical protein